MPNETHNPPIDITTLVWEPAVRPRDTLPFDPEVDITEKDWETIIEKYEENKKEIAAGQIEHTLFISTAFYAAAVTVLSPRRIPQLGVEPTPNQIMKKVLTNSHDDLFDGWRIYPYVPGIIKIGLGKTTKHWIFAQDNWLEMLHNQHRLKNEAWQEAWVRQTLSMAILAPSKINELGVDDKGWEEYLVKMWAQNQNRSDDSNIISIAAFKLFHPQKAGQYEIDQETWQKLRQRLQEFRQSEFWSHFCELSICLAILAAKEAKITDNGIELVMPDRKEPFKSDIPPIPPVRKF